MSDEIEALREAIGEDKLERFDESTAEAILKQLGIERGRIKQLRSDLETAFSCEWLSDYLPVPVRTGRCARFSMVELLTKPGSSPILLMVDETMKELQQEFHFVFKAYELGRMVASVAAIRLERPHITIPSSPRRPYITRITCFDEFFKTLYGDIEI